MGGRLPRGDGARSQRVALHTATTRARNGRPPITNSSCRSPPRALTTTSSARQRGDARAAMTGGGRGAGSSPPRCRCSCSLARSAAQFVPRRSRRRRPPQPRARSGCDAEARFAGSWGRRHPNQVDVPRAPRPSWTLRAASGTIGNARLSRSVHWAHFPRDRLDPATRQASPPDSAIS